MEVDTTDSQQKSRARRSKVWTVNHMEADQMSLFEETPSPPTRGQKRFLSDTRKRFELLAQSPTLLAEAAVAARTTVKAAAATSHRSGSESFEKALVAALLLPAVGQAVSDELVSLSIAAGDASVRGVTFENGVGLADLLVVWDIDKREPLTVAVNVKKLSHDTHKTEGCSLTQLVALATDPDFDVRKPRASVSIPTWRWVLEWCARRRKIQPKTDYYLLVGQVDAGKLNSLWFQGAFSTVKGDRSVLRKHANKDTVNVVTQGTDPLADTMDINALISSELLPRPDTDMLRAMLASLLTDGQPVAEVERVAGLLLDMDDAALLTWARKLVNP